jgi:Asp-tRNA(Asn)/Glu-tRNA(Gln) amidotransferase A subunit family amidase
VKNWLVENHAGSRMKLNVGRVSGSALRALDVLVRAEPLRAALAKVVRQELGIDALRALPRELRGVVPFGLEPRAARSRHTPSSAELPPPACEGVPRSASELGAAYRAGARAPLAVVERALAHAAGFGARSPLCAQNVERALREARASTERFRRGAPLGPLDGVPVVVKEELDVAGYATRLGTGFMPPDLAARDAVLVERLVAAGAIVIGQTPMTEYGLSPLGVNPHRTMPQNAQREGHLAGGSSTGSAVAVALGLAPLGLGTDGGGSIRVPAAYNGIFGIKPSYGRIPCTGHGMFGGTSVVHFGVLATSSLDLALALELAAGADAGDPPSAAAPPLAPGELRSALGRGVRGLKLGVPDGEWARADESVARAGRRALAALEHEGAELVPLELPLARHAAAIGYLTIAVEAYTALREVEARMAHALSPDLRVFLAGCRAFASDDYVDAQRLRETLREELREALCAVDLVALPTAANTAPKITASEARSGIIDMPALDAACRFVFLGNLTGLPAASAPVGTDSAGLPIGLQLVGDAWDEATVLAAVAHLERCGLASVPQAPGALDLLVEA